MRWQILVCALVLVPSASASAVVISGAVAMTENTEISLSAGRYENTTLSIQEAGVGPYYGFVFQQEFPNLARGQDASSVVLASSANRLQLIYGELDNKSLVDLGQPAYLFVESTAELHLANLTGFAPIEQILYRETPVFVARALAFNLVAVECPPAACDEIRTYLTGAIGIETGIETKLRNEEWSADRRLTYLDSLRQPRMDSDMVFAQFGELGRVRADADNATRLIHSNGPLAGVLPVLPKPISDPLWARNGLVREDYAERSAIREARIERIEALLGQAQDSHTQRVQELIGGGAILVALVAAIAPHYLDRRLTARRDRELRHTLLSDVAFEVRSNRDNLASASRFIKSIGDPASMKKYVPAELRRRAYELAATTPTVELARQPALRELLNQVYSGIAQIAATEASAAADLRRLPPGVAGMSAHTTLSAMVPIVDELVIVSAEIIKLLEEQGVSA